MQIRSLHYEEILILVTNTLQHPIILDIPWLHLPDAQISCRISTIDWTPIKEGMEQLCTSLIKMHISNLHWEEISLLVTSTPEHPIILGIRWLHLHDPPISCSLHEISGQIIVNKTACKPHVWPSHPHQLKAPRFLHRFRFQRNIMNFWIFSVNPKLVVYLLIDCTPASASFYFMEKKEGCLRPCIYYRWLKHICNLHPLVPAALEQLRAARIFTKLDLLSEYKLVCISFKFNMPSKVFTKICEHQLYVKGEKCKFHVSSVTFVGYVINQEGIEMDKSKVKTVYEWPNPRTIKQLHRFLGIANFYQCVIRNFSMIATPLTILLKKWPKSLSWSLAAEEACQRLKTAAQTNRSLWK